MKPAALLFSLVWLSACSFPSYEVHPPTCTDGRLNGEETGVDCGMAACGTGCNPGQGCNDDADCTSGQCTDSICQPAGCDDGQRDGDETGVDCGMAACSRACPPGQGCRDDADCDGGACDGNICQAANCNDQLTNGDETDRDCGGDQGCARCTVGQRCHTSSDCDGGECTTGQCRAPSCKDSLTNGNETDLNCGGDACVPCGVGQACLVTADCDAVACRKGECQPAACDDGILNQDETDLDCGGSCPSGCDDGLRCKGAGDCVSGVCPKATLRCAAPTCDDGVLNGDEPSVDCGSGCPDKCQVLDACNVGADCDTDTCSNRTCVPAAATGTPLSSVGWVATASDTFGGSSIKAVIDGSSGTDWTSGTNRYAGMWIVIDMRARQAFFRVEIETQKSLDAAESVNVWTSDDAGSFTNEVKKNVPGGTLIAIDFSVAQVARYIKLELAQGGTDWWRVNEIRVKQ